MESLQLEAIFTTFALKRLESPGRSVETEPPRIDAKPPVV
jgi:hypothetical protein